MIDQPPPLKHTSSRQRDVAISLALVVGVALIYGQSYAFAFVNYDDQDYVYENPIVRGGLTWRAVRWAFTTGHAANWHPLTWISHCIDVSLFGLWPGGHHLVAVGIHAANAVLLFAFLRLATSRIWPCTFVAAIFAFHPLRAESVAWVAERKDVLSTAFALIALIAYAVHSRRARAGLPYVATLVALACSLMSKGTFVTMPFVMLLLDVWPLRRIDCFDAATRMARGRALLLEKIPVFGVVLLASIATFTFQADAGAVMASSQIPLGPRLMNATVSVVRYLRMTVAPYGLASYYPHPYSIRGGSISIAAVIGAATLILAISAVALAMFRARPYLAVGWFWFGGTLVPVIGIVQVGNQALADRYTYVPGIGLAIAVVWLAADVATRSRATRVWIVSLGVAALLVLGVVAHRQVGFWRDSQTLMQRGADVVPDSFVSHNNLGIVLDARGDLVAAEREYRRALAIYSENPGANNNLASLLLHSNRADEAKTFIDRTIAADPRFAPGYVTRAEWLSARGERDAAFADYELAVKLKPGEKRAWHNYALALALAGRYDDAANRWREAIAIDPDYVAALDGYGRALMMIGETRAAYAALERAIALKPDDDSTRYVLAWSLATNAAPTLRDARRAVAIASAIRDRRNPAYVDALAAALASAGDFDNAATIADRAATLAADEPQLAADIRARAALYRAGRPFMSR